MLDPIYRAAGTVTQRHVWFLTPPADLSVRMTRAIAEGQAPAGDWFASRRGLGLGLPVALLCVGAGLIAVLWLYQRTKRPA
jgi:hypothetical protein